MPILPNQRHELFAQGVAKGLSATAAYIAAGYSENGADVSASRLLGIARIKDRVFEIQSGAVRKTEVTIQRVVEEYAKLAFLDIRKAFDYDGNLLDIQDLDDDTAAAIAGIEFEEIFAGKGEDRAHIGRIHKIKLSDKRAALDSLAKYLKMFTDQADVEIRIDVSAKQSLEARIAGIAARIEEARGTITT